ncbi:MAG: hypothetical protein GF368_06050 [Candidatus Aenigmarchaeota archaeon]|nr:hypothetical protein [Candidatus Aenigmarchaeota archaeon]
MKDEVIWFTELGKDKDSMGGKAFNLMKMSDMGLPVPEGFVITQNNLSNGIDLILKEYKKLLEKYGSVSVRSSANVEDSEKASFAGIFETTLNVRNKNELLISIKKCFDSIREPHVKNYSKRKGIDPGTVKMNVIIQGMIKANKSGVIFTSDPSGTRNIIIEASDGFGENVVGGKKIPSRYLVDKFTGEIVESKENSTILNDNEISELIKYAKILEEKCGRPQDVEWALDEGKIYLLQTRPLTV